MASNHQIQPQQIKQKLMKDYGIDIDELTPLLEYMLWHHKNRRQVKRDTKKRIAFLTKTLKKWQEQTEELFRNTDVKGQRQRGGVWRFHRLHGDPGKIVRRIFSTDQIAELLHDHLVRLELQEVDPTGLNWLVFNLAHLLRHTEFTTQSPIHQKKVNWPAVLRLFEYWRPEIENSGVKFTDVIPHPDDDPSHACDALRKRFEETRRKIKKEYGRSWTLILDPKVLRILEDRKALDRVTARAWKRWEGTPKIKTKNSPQRYFHLHQSLPSVT